MRFFTIPNSQTTDKERTNLMAPGGLTGPGFGFFDLKISNYTDPIDPPDTAGGAKKQRSRAGVSSDIGGGKASGPSAL